MGSSGRRPRGPEASRWRCARSQRCSSTRARSRRWRRAQWRLFDSELVRSIGMLPMEYLYFYYYREEAVENILRSGGTRAAQIAAINDALWPVLRARVDADDPAGAADAWTRAMETRDETYFARERGEALIVPTSPD